MGAITRRKFLSLSGVWRVALTLCVSVLCLSSVCMIAGCENRRPPGYLNIGKVSEIASQSGFLKDKQIYLHRDDRGIAVMSTLCSHDLSPLKLVEESGSQVFVSDYNPSRYDVWGNVLAGPATRPLPFYRARVDAGVYGGAIDTIYVQIGSEVDRSWRLAIP